MEVKTICKGCGAPLHYEKTDYGKMAKCTYCRREYQIFNSELCGINDGGRIMIEMGGVVKEFYIAEEAYRPLCMDTIRDIDGKLETQRLRYKTALRLIEI